MTKIGEIERLHALLKEGALTQAEYDSAKAKLLGSAASGDGVVGGVCARLGQTTPLSSGTWRIMFLAPMALSFFVDALFEPFLGFSKPVTGGFGGALFGGPIILYVLLYLLGVNTSASKQSKDAG